MPLLATRLLASAQQGGSSRSTTPLGSLCFVRVHATTSPRCYQTASNQVRHDGPLEASEWRLTICESVKIPNAPLLDLASCTCMGTMFLFPVFNPPDSLNTRRKCKEMQDARCKRCEISRLTCDLSSRECERASSPDSCG
ncbi:hypothetical protein M440DRAFT_1118530 [Trichoderma longibrachiatum ATCC 18648]|uniref:Uncharacterized protein n=1 Tax=Trichoderma longibrachiatum ATCC 18648 TaxID=983965 RepID=A0A2T4CF54_TRILO|nr:hypothetical protein M440DRAFT_1118530 [Trichoderma longibrachiatum ATCC 18648]